LQKLLYYAQAWYMVENDGNPLFSDDIEAWKYGPVVRTVYDEYKIFGHSPIVAEVKEKDLSFLNDKTVKFLDQFFNDFMDYSAYSAYSLVGMIYKEDPWKDAFDKNNEQSHEKISPESMYAFYYKKFVEKEEKLLNLIRIVQ
jgi:uncharacterized phage-associated protein